MTVSEMDAAFELDALELPGRADTHGNDPAAKVRATMLIACAVLGSLSTYHPRFWGGPGQGEQPNPISMVINLRTAKVLGPDVQPPLLARANEVIE